MRARRIILRLGAVVGSLVFAQASVGAVALTTNAAPASVAPVSLAPSPSAERRVAYTDDSDGLLLFRGANGSGILPSFADPNAQHEGEISNEIGGVQAFVSTRDDPGGQVYVTGLNGSAAAVPVTCDSARKTHPVVSPSGTLIAYAIASGGQDRIQVANIAALVASPAPSAACSGVTYRTLAGQHGQNRWPSWVPSDPASVSATPVLVYSSTRDNPLGDLYLQPVTGATATRLTDGDLGDDRLVANTQPTVTADPTAVLFTTTMFRPDGSIGEITFPSRADPALPRTIHSAWNGPAPQSSAASFDGASRIAFTSTATNALGSVRLASDTDPTPDVPVLFDTSSITGIGSANAWLPLADPAWDSEGGLYTTARRISADVRDARADDGTGGRLIAHRQFDNDGTPEVLDSAAPDYSPDGQKITYSQRLEGTGHPGRRIVVANANGTDPVPVQDGWRGAASNATTGRTDLDVQPAWSPDGKKIAFVRAEYAYVTPGDFTLVGMGVRVVDLDTHVVRTVAASSASDPYFYQDPDWSPDGTRLAMTRSPIPNLGVSASTAPDSIGAGGTTSVTVTVANSGYAAARSVTVSVSGGTAFTLVPPTGCTAQGDGIRCAIGTLGAGEDITFTISATAASGAPERALIRARASAATADADFSDNAADATVEIIILNALAPITLAPTSPAPGTPVGILAGDVVRGLVSGPVVPDAPRLWIADPVTGAGAALAAPAVDCPSEPCALAGRSPEWSPDGTRIVYDSGGQLKIAKLSVGAASILLAPVALSAHSITALTGFSSFTSGAGGTPTGSRAAISAAHDPQWVGDQIYFTGQPAGQPADSGIYAVALDGSGLHAIAQAPGPQSAPGVQRGADLALTLNAAPTTVDLGQTSMLRATVTNDGVLGAEAVTVVIDLPSGLAPGSAPAGCTLTAGQLRCTVSFLAPGKPITVQLAVTGTAAGSHEATATAASVTRDLDVSNNTDTATVTVRGSSPPPPATTRQSADLAVTVAFAPSADRVGYVGGTVPATLTVTNNGPDPALGAILRVSHTGPMTLTGSPACLQTGATCPLGTLAPGASRTRTVTLTPGAAGTGSLTATVAAAPPDPVSANDTATATLTLKQPTLRMLPGVGPPGRVALAYGSDFPPGSTVTLVWKPGVTTYPGPFTVAADGTLRVPELVVRRDLIGQRLLVATSTSALFTPVHALMLVVPRTEAPPRFLGRN